MEGSKGACKTLTYQPAPGDRWSEDKIQEVVELWALSKEDEQNYRDLHHKLADIDHFKNDPHVVIRYMTANWGYKGAETAFRNMMQWREANQIDELLKEYSPPQMLLDGCPSAMLRDYDRDGDPIYVERGGAVDTVSLLKHFSREELLRFAHWQRERNTYGIWLNDYEERQGRKVKNITIIYDLKGLSIHHMNPKALELFKELMRQTQLYYPGPIKRMIVIRAPKVFQLVWNVVKHFFPPQARAKMIFAGNSNYLEALQPYMDSDVLPPCLYEKGSGDVAVGMMQSLDGPDYTNTKGAHCNDTTRTEKKKRVKGESVMDTDEESTSSNEESCILGFVPGSPSSNVNSKVLLRGSWKRGRNGNVEVQYNSSTCVQ